MLQLSVVVIALEYVMIPSAFQYLHQLLLMLGDEGFPLFELVLALEVL